MRTRKKLALTEEAHLLHAEANVARYLAKQIERAAVIAVGAVVLNGEDANQLAIAGDDGHAHPRTDGLGRDNHLWLDAAPHQLLPLLVQIVKEQRLAVGQNPVAE